MPLVPDSASKFAPPRWMPFRCSGTGRVVSGPFPKSAPPRQKVSWFLGQRSGRRLPRHCVRELTRIFITWRIGNRLYLLIGGQTGIAQTYLYPYQLPPNTRNTHLPGYGLCLSGWLPLECPGTRAGGSNTSSNWWKMEPRPETRHFSQSSRPTKRPLIDSFPP